MMQNALLAQLEELYKLGFLPKEEYEKRISALPNPEKDRAKNVFNYFDLNSDGKIHLEEFQNLFFEINEILSVEQIKEIFNFIDVDKDEVINFDEFYSFWNAEKKSENLFDERVRFLKAKLKSEPYMKGVMKSAKRLKDSITGKTGINPVSPEDTLSVDVNVQLGVRSDQPRKAGWNISHMKNDKKARALRSTCNLHSTAVMFTVECPCHPHAEEQVLIGFCNYWNELSKTIIKKEGKKLPVKEFKATIGNESGKKVLRMTAEIHGKFSMMITGLLGSLGLRNLRSMSHLDKDFFRADLKLEVSRGCMALLDMIKDKKTTDPIKFFLSTFGGSKMNFNFRSFEEAINHPLLKEAFEKDNVLGPLYEVFREIFAEGGDEEKLKKFLEEGQKVMFGNHGGRKLLQYCYFMQLCGTQCVETVSKVSFVAGDDVFEIDFYIPNLFSYFPTDDKMRDMGMYDNVYQVPHDAAQHLSKSYIHSHNGCDETKLNLDYFGGLWKCDICNNKGFGWAYTCTDSCSHWIHPIKCTNNE